MPWQAFWALVKRTGMMRARARLQLMDAGAWGVAAGFGGTVDALMRERSDIAEIAFPGSGKRAVQFALKQSED